MNPAKLDAAVAHMRANWEKITDDESAYKPGIARHLKPVFESAARLDHDWSARLKKVRQQFSSQVGWRTADALIEYALAHPRAVGKAVAALEGPEDADLFWEIALAPVGGREGLKDDFKHLYAPGARATVVSLVLFSRDCEKFPIFRATLSGRPLATLLGEPIDNRSISSRLVSFYDGLARLGRLLRERGVDVKNNLDVQGVLWVVNYSRVV